MSVFDPESTRNGFEFGYELTGQGGNPYRFHLTIDIDPDHATVDRDENGHLIIQIAGMGMNDMAMFRKDAGRTISDAKRARRERDGA